ncbi:MAG: cell division protein ZapB [Acidobacteriota bacterium]
MSTTWLRELEEKVQEAADRLRHQRAENARLEARIAELDDRVQELEGQLAQADDSGEAAWTQEREEIRGRVEKLAQHLGDLLSDDGAETDGEGQADD